MQAIQHITKTAVAAKVCYFHSDIRMEFEDDENRPNCPKLKKNQNEIITKMTEICCFGQKMALYTESITLVDSILFT